MQDSTTREKILKKIRQALSQPRTQPYPNIDWDSNVYAQSTAPPEETFAREFTAIGGHFVFCEGEIDFLEQLVKLSEQNSWKRIYCYEDEITALLKEAEFPYTNDDDDFKEGMVSITSCEALVARTGSILVSSRSRSGRRLTVVPTSHIIVAYPSQIVPDFKDALLRIKTKYGEQVPSFIAAITGPSRTADIEKTLVTPAHGPRDIFVFLIDEAEAESQ